MVYESSNDKKIVNCSNVQRDKLNRLVEEKQIGTHDLDTVIRNYSAYQLSDAEKKVLSYGLNFSLPPKKLNYGSFMLPFEKLYRESRGKGIRDSGKMEFKTALKNIAFEGYNNFNSRKTMSLSNEERAALQQLKENDSIVIQKADKGNVVVIINKCDYIDTLVKLLSDKDKFAEVHIPPGKEILNLLLSQEKVIVDLLKTLKKEYKQKKQLPGGITDTTYWKLYPQGTKPGRMYGSAKVHKPLEDGVPKFRPIISAIGTASYKIAKFLVPILKPFSTNEYSLSDSFKFKEEILQQNSNTFMSTMDIESLFTNLPLNETIDICIKLVFEHNNLVEGMNKEEFRRLLVIATQDSMFIFDGKYYKQVDGVAMGSPLGPILANIFLSHWEEKWLNKCSDSFKPSFYRRYVDDIFLLFNTQEESEHFTNYVNKQHKKMVFVPDNEKDNCISFLDISVIRKEGSLVSNIYRKPTFSGVYTSYNSFMPTNYKKSLVITLVYRLFTIISEPTTFTSELKYLREILFKNGYPLAFLDSCVKKFYKNRQRVAIATVERDEVTIVLPYLGTVTTQIKTKLSKLFGKYLPNCNIKVVSKMTYRMGNLFRFKDIFPNAIMSDIVYFYKCSSCNATYVGNTCRHRKVRECDHMGISPRTGKVVRGTLTTAVRDHMLICNTVVGSGDFSILSQGGFKHDLEMKESIMIKKLHPSLNKDKASIPLYLF